MESFKIQCSKCLTETVIEDGYNNGQALDIKIIGQNLVEIKCKRCGQNIVSIDGDIV